MNLSQTGNDVALGFALLLVVNGLAFLAFAIDKSRAERDGWRIPEKNLLLLAFLGGSMGAVAAQHFLRHKTVKQPFSTYLWSIFFFHIALLMALLAPEIRHFVL